MRIVADDKIPFLKGVFEKYCRVDYLPGSDISKHHLQDAEVLIIRTRTRCDRSLLGGSAVRFIATATIGFDHIDTDYCQEAGIRWTSAPGCNSGSVAQYLLAALLHLAEKHKVPLSGQVMGVIGAGHVGSKVEQIARLLGMQVLLNDPPRSRAEGPGNFVSLEELQATSDIISLHVPLNMGGRDKTYHLVDKRFIEQCQKRPYLLNTSRGEVVDTNALKSAVQNDSLAGAVIDVWENEPDIDRDLLQMTMIASPHIAGYSLDGKANGTSMVVQAVNDFCGFGLNNWYPPEVPGPANNTVTIDCTGKTLETVLQEAVLYSYDIMGDDRRLRQSPETFELQRSNYPFRREPGSYRIRLQNDKENAMGLLGKIGFRTSV